MQLADKLDISINGTILVVGHVTHIYIEEDGYKGNGIVDLNAIDTICVSGLDTYHKVEKIATYPFARPSELPDFE